MRIIDRYLGVHIVGATILVLFVLIALDSFFSFVEELDDVGRNNYGSMQAAIYILFSLPGRIYQYLPSATLVGALVGLGSLAGSSQITAMRAAGMSVTEFVLSTFKTGILLVIVTFLIGEWAAPHSWNAAESLRASALAEQFSVNRKGGLWLRDQQRFVHAGSVVDQSRLVDVRIFEFDQLALRRILTGKSASKNNDGSWTMLSVDQIDVFDEKIQRQAFDSLRQSRLVPEGMLDVLRIDPDQMAARDLWQYMRYMRANALDSSNYLLAFLDRFVHPLTILVMLLIAVPFLFVNQRGGGLGQRLFFGIILGAVFFLSNMLCKQLGVVYGIPVAVSILIVPVIAIGLACWRIRRL